MTNCVLQVFSIDEFAESSSCDDLYFRKSVMFWDNYQVGGVSGSCHYNKPASYNGYKWDQKSEKLARTSIMFTDKTSIQSPDQGIQVKFGNSGPWEKLWDASYHKVVFPWTSQSGFRTGEGTDWVQFHFGPSNPTVVVWGMRFMKAQVVSKGSLSVSLAYSYHHDEAGGAYGSTWRKPTGTQDGNQLFSISASDLDESGLYYFKQPAPNQDKNLILIASHLFVKIAKGYLNFDFLGTFYDFTVAKSGSKQGVDDDFNERGISNFWMTGWLDKSEINEYDFDLLFRGRV